MFTFQRVDVQGGWAGTVFGILWRNGHNYLRIDGHCRYFAYQLGRNDRIVTGSLTGAEAIALANETKYSTWPDLNGLVATGGWFDAPTQVLNDGTNELFCRQNCRDSPQEPDVESALLLDSMFDPADVWRDRLLSEGTPVGGDVRFAVAIQNKIIHAGTYLEWPLSTPIKDYATDPTVTPEDENYVEVRATLARGADAAALRLMREQAVATAISGSQTEGWITVDGPGDRFYEVVVSDVLPYEDEDGIVPRHTRE